MPASGRREGQEGLSVLFPGLPSFLKFCTPQINASGSAWGLQAPGGGGASVQACVTACKVLVTPLPQQLWGQGPEMGNHSHLCVAWHMPRAQLALAIVTISFGYYRQRVSWDKWY